MSYSISTSGTISTVRQDVRERMLMSRGGRAAAALINAELDVIEAQGATHATVSGSGHEGGHSISVSRDIQAEKLWKEAQERKAFEAWRETGLQSGYLSGRVLHASESCAIVADNMKTDNHEKLNKSKQAY